METQKDYTQIFTGQNQEQLKILYLQAKIAIELVPEPETQKRLHRHLETVDQRPLVHHDLDCDLEDVLALIAYQKQEMKALKAIARVLKRMSVELVS